MQKRVAAVVVLYNPPDSVPENVNTYIEDIEQLLVFDNSPEASKLVVEKVCRSGKAKYLTAGTNVGVGSALNIAARRAIDGGYDYLLTMDQDSAATKGMVQIMLDYASGHDSIGLISPFHMDRNVPTTPPLTDADPIVVAMTSGNLLNLGAYERVGGFLEKLFIDSIDHEYCLRLQMHGFKVVRANRAILSHSQGHVTRRRFIWRTAYPQNYNPLRYYYQTRNRFYLRRLYGDRFPEYFRFDIRMYWGEVAKMVLYERQRVRKIAMICRGFLALWKNDFSAAPQGGDGPGRNDSGVFLRLKQDEG
jgi:rhamnosyltransferase